MKVIYTIARTSLALSVIVLFTVSAFAQDKLLLSEIVVTPTAGEMIEIYNPGTSTVTLTNYYISDATFAGGPTYYYQVVQRADSAQAGGGGSFGDFSAQFPVGATIAAGEYQTLSLAGSDDFFAEYGENPTYELYEDGGSADDIPDMLEAETGSIGSNPVFSSSGEVTILYYWDGVTDLVLDIDYVVWGDKAEAVDKTGIKFDGPDAATDSTSYLADVAVADQAVAPSHSFGNSLQRIDFTEGSEVTTGGNGVGGADETSENYNDTWDANGAPTPNAGPQTIADLQPLLLSEIVVTPTLGEYVEIHNPGTIVVDLTNYYITDATNPGTPLYYYNIVLDNGTSGGASTSDFNARFPSGATINPGEFQTVGLNGALNFNTTFGVDPTYELIATDAGVRIQTVPVAAVGIRSVNCWKARW